MKINYEQRYNEALDRAKKLKETCDSTAVIGWCEHIFPELKGNKDRKIRNAIYDALKYLEREHSWDFLGDVDILDAYTWLEKQGEQKPVEWHSEDEQNLNACLGYIPDEFLRRWLKDVIHAKYDKPTDKVEPSEQKSNWSEEDEKKKTLLIRILEVNHPNGYFKVNPVNTLHMEAISTEELIFWLKSLKPKL